VLDLVGKGIFTISTAPPFIPAPRPHAILLPSHHGYTGRRAGEAGSARGVRGRRRTSRSGLAENGLPPATRGETGFSDQPSSLEARKSAPGVPVRHTGWLTGWFRRTVQSPSDARSSGLARGRRHRRNRRQTPSGLATSEGPKSRAKTAERGAERCHLFYFYEAAFSAPSDLAL
jgi:hypothetical protein